MNILVVDDDDDARVYLDRALTSQGHEVVVAANGLEALAIVRKSPPSMIVSDIMMPEMDGFSLCLHLKDDEKLRKIPFIFYTATYTDPQSMKLAEEMGVSGFLIKPLEYDVLVEKLTGILAQHASGDTRYIGLPQKPLKELETKHAALMASKLDKKTVELKEIKDDFRRIFETMQDGYVCADLDGRILLTNPAAVRILGYDTDKELIGENIAEKLYADPDDRNELKNLLVKNSSVVGFETKYKKKTGEIFAADVSSHLLFDADGEPQALECLFRDITERKNLERQRLQSQRMEAIGQLAGGVAHDFNNLLSIMIGNAELLRNRVGDDEESQREVDEIVNAIRRGASLTQRILAFSRQQNLSPQPTRINDLVLGLEDMLQRTLGEAIELHISLGTRIDDVLIDPHQFESALVNLAINARDAMPKGGKLEIETDNVTLDDSYAQTQEEVTPGEYVKITVSDTGIGIPSDVLAKVFEPFFTTKEVGKGSGLGLSMVYGFAKQSNGHVTIHNRDDGGTAVNLYLPRSPVSADKGKTEVKKTEFASGSERILVVEDNDKVREMPIIILRDQGYAVAEARNGQEAIKLLKEEQPFDLMFTDVVLPGGMNGLEIANAAKRLHPNIKVLYTTGHAQNVITRNGGLGAGAPLINKPYSRTDLLEKVRSTLDNDDV